MENKPPPTSEKGSGSFEEKKTNFFVKIGLKLKDEFLLHREAGLWGKDTEKEEEAENWRSVSEHCLMEVARVSVFAKQLGLSESVTKDLTEAAALHDFFKKEEMKKAGPNGLSWYDMEVASKRAAEFLRKNGIREKVITLVNSVSLDSLKDMEKICGKIHLSGSDIARLVLHYVDDYTQGSDWVEPAVVVGGKKMNSLDTRVTKAEENPKYKQLDEDGRKFFGGEVPHEAQRRIGHLVEKRLFDILNAKSAQNIDPEDLPQFIDQQIIAKIESENI